MFYNQAIYCFLGWTRNKVAECGANLAGLPARTARDGKKRVSPKGQREVLGMEAGAPKSVFRAEYPSVVAPAGLVASGSREGVKASVSRVVGQFENKQG